MLGSMYVNKQMRLVGMEIYPPEHSIKNGYKIRNESCDTRTLAYCQKDNKNIVYKFFLAIFKPLRHLQYVQQDQYT
jgi:hypothetical protein